jgi:hypothetical protein
MVTSDTRFEPERVKLCELPAAPSHFEKAVNDSVTEIEGIAITSSELVVSTAVPEVEVLVVVAVTL